MRIEVLYGVNGSTQEDVYTCQRATRQILAGGIANIIFRNGPAIDRDGRKVLIAQYQEGIRIITYED